MMNLELISNTNEIRINKFAKVNVLEGARIKPKEGRIRAAFLLRS